MLVPLLRAAWRVPLTCGRPFLSKASDLSAILADLGPRYGSPHQDVLVVAPKLAVLQPDPKLLSLSTEKKLGPRFSDTARDYGASRSQEKMKRAHDLHRAVGNGPADECTGAQSLAWKTPHEVFWSAAVAMTA